LDIKIIGKHIDITEAIRAEIEEKISGLPKFYSSIIDVEVIVEGSKDGVTNSVEIIVRARHNHTFVAKEVGQDIFGCVEEVIRKIERQITKQKQKERDNKHMRKTAER
jgi:putative sigma-54 modulation protein